MSEPGGLLPTNVTPEAVQAQLGKILASPVFSNSERLSRFLRFAVENALAGSEDRLREYTIGVEVFDRNESFDPRIDSIVRVEARRLRAKLERYYQTPAARGDGFVIQFRKGSYVPLFALSDAGDTRLRKAAPAPLRSRDWFVIAVLPFTAGGAGAEFEFFLDGLAQETINGLTRLDRVKVVSRTSSFRYRDPASRDLRAIGAELGAEFLLEGSVRRVGARLRISAELASVADGVYVWSDSVDADVKDMLKAQQEAAAQLLRSLARKLAGARVSPGWPQPVSRHAEASVLCQLARHCLNKLTEENLRKAENYFLQAAAENSSLAAARAGLSETLLMRALLGYPASSDCLAQGREAAQRALQLDVASAPANTCLGIASVWFDLDVAAGIAAFDRALDADADYPAARIWRGLALAVGGDFGAATAELRLAHALDPVEVARLGALGRVLMAAGEYEQAIQQFLMAIHLDPGFHLPHWGLGLAYLQKDMPVEAAGCFEKAGALAGPSGFLKAASAAAAYASGNKRLARRLIDEIVPPPAVLRICPFFPELPAEPRLRALAEAAPAGAAKTGP